MKKCKKLIFVAAMAVCMAIMVVSPARFGGYVFGQSPFTVATSDTASEQEKAALLSQIDATDSGYSRSGAENEKVHNQNRTQAWLDSIV